MTVLAARCHPDMLRVVESGKITPSSRVTAEVPMEQAGDVLESMTGFSTLGYSEITN